ncbi:MAG: helix-turn-helix domain-containing protein [Cyclobacteriaceae bacterium]|nr:helix-turn-helix domain-containing protein [Cyclobacteriaceae bacterium]
MAANIITVEDLERFKEELLEEFKKLLSQRQTTPARKWLKSHEVMKLLLVSPGTLQNLRANGTLPFTKIGGAIFYNYDDIQQLLEKHKQNRDIFNKKDDPWRHV